MADVRSLLREQRAARRINHPHAIYTASGLSCRVCHLHLKSDSLWQSHLASVQHTASLKKIGSQAAGLSNRTKTEATYPSIRKRKAEDVEDSEKPTASSAKRSKSTSETGIITGETSEIEEPDSVVELRATPHASTPNKSETPPTPPANTTAQPAESKTDLDLDAQLAAFERDIALIPQELNAQSALTAKATIMAKPMTATEIASKSREEASTQAKERRETEIEGEKEDAARQLEEEFDEMDALEERVRRLKEKRENLKSRSRNYRQNEATGDGSLTIANDTGQLGGEMDGDSDDDDEGIDDWGLR